MIDVEEIDFESCIEEKGEFPSPMDPFPEPIITISAPGATSAYITQKAVEVMGLIPEDYLVAAPNPEGRESFFITPNNDEEGYSVSLREGRSGARIARNLFANLGEQFDEQAHYKIEGTGKVHPRWGYEIYVATPVDITEFDHRLTKKSHK
jgi:hypothetical protein